MFAEDRLKKCARVRYHTLKKAALCTARICALAIRRLIILICLTPNTGNEGGFFEMHEQTGELFLVREIDLESLTSSGLTLQVQVRIRLYTNTHKIIP